MKKNLVILGAGGECVHNIIHARECGYYTIAVDYDPNAPGASRADEFLPVNAYDPAEVVPALKAWGKKGRGVDGIICVGLDAPRTVAAVGEAFGVPSVSMHTAILASDKLAMKDRLKEAGIPIPWYAAATCAGDIKSAFWERNATQLIIKPVDSRGARGVLLLNSDSDFERAFDTAISHSPRGAVMIEEFLDGPQVSTEGLIIAGKAHIPGFSDRNYDTLNKFKPHVIENGGDLPSSLPPSAQREIKELTGKAGLALGIFNGPVKGDMVWHDKKAYVIEIAARHSGGYFITHEIPLNTGLDVLGVSYKLATGAPVSESELVPLANHGVCQRYLVADPGVVTSVTGVEEARRMHGVAYVEVRVQPGDIVKPVQSHPGRAGIIMTTASDNTTARQIMDKALSTIKIFTTPHC